jgi:hypothetical protein
MRGMMAAVVCGTALGWAVFGAVAQGAPTSITYQGRLEQNGAGVTGSLPMAFRLYDAAAGGSQVGSTISLGSVDVAGGVFTQALDFGAIDAGNTALWLEVTVDGFVMSPRQAITASPYSLQTRGIYVDNSGRVGIGTDSPEAALDVAGPGAVARVVSTQDFSPAVVRLRGSVPGIGGFYSRIEFENGFGSEIFGIQHDSAFGIDYLTLRTAAVPGGLVRVREDGAIGIGDLPTMAPVHVTDRDIGVYNDGMLNETLALEDNDAVLGIYSSNTGSWGSAIVLGEVVGNQLVDKWGLARTTSNASPELRMTFGTGANYAQNPTVFRFTPGGLEFPDGSMQAAATGADYAVRLAGELFSNRGQISGPFFPDTVTIEITQPGQRILVNGVATMRFQNGRGFEYRIAYRPAGSGGALSYATQRMVYSIGSNDLGEIHTVAATTIIDGLAPGTYEIGFLFDDIADYGTPTYVGQQLTALTF